MNCICLIPNIFSLFDRCQSSQAEQAGFMHASLASFFLRVAIAFSSDRLKMLYIRYAIFHELAR